MINEDTSIEIVKKQLIDSLYVDDLVVAGDHPEEIYQLTEQLDKALSSKDMNLTKYKSTIETMKQISQTVSDKPIEQITQPDKILGLTYDADRDSFARDFYVKYLFDESIEKYCLISIRVLTVRDKNPILKSIKNCPL